VHESLRGALSTFWARDAGVFASLHRPQDDRRAWSAYLDGLLDTYAGWGVAHIVDRNRLERDGCQLFWLLHDVDGRLVGGLRVEGPFSRALDYAGVNEMIGSVDHDRLVLEIGRAAEQGLIEFKGAWTVPDRPGAGQVLGRCMQHSIWWLDVPQAFCISATHAENRWRTTGAERIGRVAPVTYPTEAYQSVAVLWGVGHQGRVDAGQRVLIDADRRYLTPARGRLSPLPDDSTQWHPELLFDFDDRVRELAAGGIRSVDNEQRCNQELEDLLPPIEAEVRTEPAHWIHLPWRGLALRLPGPNAFWRLRTDRNRHKLLDRELTAMRARTVGVVGLSVGSAAAYTVTQEALCGRLRLADHDRLAATNLNRLAASIVELGQPKTHTVARRIAELDPYIPVSLFDEGVSDDNIDSFLEGLDAVVEECDSIDIKLLVRTRAAEGRIPVIMETSDRGLLDVERFDLEPDREPFHGLVGNLDVAELRDLETDDKVPHVLAILEADKLSAPMAASMIEIDQTTRTWPQLASDVALGSSLAAAALRRLFTDGASLRSGRTRLDLDATLDGLAQPVDQRPTRVEPAPTARTPLPPSFAEAIVEAAGLAPSGGNMQPWCFELGETAFSVTIAPNPAVGMDIGLRGSAVACGAALANAAIVAASHSRSSGSGAPEVVLDLDRPDLAGRVVFGQSDNEEWARLAPLITKRISNRHYGPAASLSPDQVAALQAAAEAGGGRISYVAPADLGDLSDLWAEADRARMLSPRLHREMMSELRRAGIDPLEEGIDERTFEFSPADLAKLAVLRRPEVLAQLERWDGGARLGDDTRKRFRCSSGLLVVVISGNSQVDYVRGGVALQRTWLEATRLGLGLHPMSPVFGYAHSEEELAEVIRHDRAESLFALSRTAWADLGIAPGESFVLASRVISGPAPTGISQRRAPSTVVSGSLGKRAMDVTNMS